MPSGVYLTFLGSFVFGTPGFPLSDVALQQVAADAAASRLDVKPVRVFRFDEIHEAHRVMEANETQEMVVVHDSCSSLKFKEIRNEKVSRHSSPGPSQGIKRATAIRFASDLPVLIPVARNRAPVPRR
jgi:hypothetical protein